MPPAAATIMGWLRTARQPFEIQQGPLANDGLALLRPESRPEVRGWWKVVAAVCQKPCLIGVATCLFGAIVGLIAGTAVSMIVPNLLKFIVGRDLLPTILHMMSLYLIGWSVGSAVGGGLAICTYACRCCKDDENEERPLAVYCSQAPAWRSCRLPGLVFHFKCWTLLLLLVMLMSPQAVKVLLQVIKLLLFDGGPWPRPGYCDAVHRAAEARSRLHTSVWWKQWGDTPSTAASRLVHAMSFEEKASLLTGEGFGPFGQKDGAYVGGVPAIPRLLIPSIKMQDAAQGFRTMKRSQVGTVTAFPCLLALAATWDRGLVGSFSRALGDEFKAKGANVILGPSLNVHRVGRNGRNAEYLSGEDPYLGAVLGREYVLGVQSKKVAAVAKHFIANHQEDERMTMSAYVSDRALFEVYYPPFEAAIGAGAAALMCAYNRINGSYACGNSHTLDRHLRGALGFSAGWVMSDWWALRDYPCKSANGGVDQDMPGTDGMFDAQELEDGLPDGDAQLDRMTRRVLEGMLSVGALDEETCTAPCNCNHLLYHVNATSEAHVTLARTVGAQSAVLLKNEDGVLPLAHDVTIALVGSACDASHDIDVESATAWNVGDYYVVGGSGRVVSDKTVSIKTALERRGVQLHVSATDRVADAVSAAHDADVVLACGGGVTQESYDRSSLRLDQHDFLSELSQQEGLPPLVIAVMAPGQVGHTQLPTRVPNRSQCITIPQTLAPITRWRHLRGRSMPKRWSPSSLRAKRPATHGPTC